MKSKLLFLLWIGSVIFFSIILILYYGPLTNYGQLINGKFSEINLLYIFAFIALISPIIVFFYNRNEEVQLFSFVASWFSIIFLSGVVLLAFSIDTDCNLDDDRPLKATKIAIATFINDIKYFSDKRKQYLNPNKLNELCEIYNKYQEEVKQMARIDYRDNQVNKLIFDLAFLDMYYSLKDIGEKEYI